MKKAQFTDLFLQEMNSFIQKSQQGESRRNSLNCQNCFENNNSYQEEKKVLARILDREFNNTVEQGNELENLIKSLFEKISLIHNVKLTNKSINIGQTDIQLFPVDDDDMLYEIWGIKNNIPKSIIGECKNYHTKKVDLSEIEKICWRTCKGSCLSFFIGFQYTEDALDEISYFNHHKELICHQCQGSLIVPLTVDMLEVIIENNINFCYFVKWAIQMSKMTSIINYIQRLD